MFPFLVQRVVRVLFVVCLVSVGALVSATLVWAAALANDNAANADYGNGWQTGDNGGAGWGGSWTLSTINTAGHFVGNSTGNNSGVGTGDGDINTAGNTAWGLWANAGGRADATRSFSGAFGPGDRLTLQMDNGLVDSGARVGLALQNAANENVLDIYFQGGSAFYVAEGSAVNTSGTGFSRQGLNITVTLLTSTTYQVTFQRLEDGTSATVTGTVKSPSGGQTITNLRLFNAGSGGGATKDLFFNRLTVTPAQCWATPDNGTTVYGSVDASAVRGAVGAAAPNSTVKIAGYCAGVANQSGTNQVALITQSVTLAGGYAPTDWTTANPLANPTTLDARGGGRVVYANVAATLQGFTVTNGFLNAGAASLHGGGIFAAGALTLTEMVVYSNTLTGTGGTQNGGGVYITGAALITSSAFVSNAARSNGGGGYFAGSVTLAATTFSNNTVAGSVSCSGFSCNAINNSSGGGGYFAGSAVLAATTFSDNIVAGSASCNDCNAINNSSGGGGYFAGSTTLTATVFSNNTAAGSASCGGFFCTATNNPAGGGAAFQNANAKALVNVLFARNRASGRGAAVYVANAAPLSLLHTTIVSPTAPTGGTQAIYVAGGTVYITNTLIATHTTGIQQAGGSVTQNYNLFSNVTNPAEGTVLGGPSPLGAAAFFDTVNYTLTAASAAIDIGINAGSNSDYFGNPRPQGTAPDAGYTESPFTPPALPPTCFAEYTGDATTDFSSADARALREAILAASAGGTVKVAGYCAGVAVHNGSLQVAFLPQPLTVAGGYTPTDWFTYNPVGNPTILDAQSNGRVLYAGAEATLQGFTLTNGAVSGDGGGLYAAQPITLTEMTIYTNTATRSGGSGTVIRGGGAYFAGNVTLTATTFVSNTATTSASGNGGTTTAGYGGGAYFAGSATLTNTTFRYNQLRPNLVATAPGTNSSAWGGGAYFAGQARLAATVFSTNTATGIASNIFPDSAGYGGGAFFAADTILVSTIFSANTASANSNGNAPKATGRGGGAYFGSTVTLTTTVFSANAAFGVATGTSTLTANGYGGGAFVAGATAKSAHNLLIASNTAQTSGAGLYVADAAPLRLVYMTLANPTLNARQGVYMAGGTVYITNSIVASHTVGIQQVGGTVSAWNTLFASVGSQTSGSVTNNNPVVGEAGFVDPANADYHLTALSAAINAGTTPDPDVTTDFEGDARPWGSAPDIGYDEARAYISVQTNNWGLPGTWDVNSVPNDVRAVVLISTPHTVTVESNFVSQHLSVRGSLVVPVGNVLTIAQPVSNAGVIQMLRNVNNANVAFEIPSGGAFPAYRLVDVNTANNLGVVTATVWGLLGGEYCTTHGAASLGAYVRRCFEVTPANQAAANVRLWLLNSELNGLAPGSLYVYRNFPNGYGMWVQLSPTPTRSNDGNTYTWVEDTTPGFSFFLAAGPTAPTALTLKAFTAQARNTEILAWASALGLLLIASYGLGRWAYKSRLRAPTERGR